MFKKINPMVRAIGTMGAIAAVTGGVTFAALQSNVVALTDNNLTSATAALQIGSDAEAQSSTSVKGATGTLTPGTPTTFKFYLHNTGQTPLDITANVVAATTTTTPTGTVIPDDQVSLGFECGSGTVTYNLAQWKAGQAVIPGSAIAAGADKTCTETISLSSSYTGGGQSVTPFNVNFVGNQAAAVATTPPTTGETKAL